MDFFNSGIKSNSISSENDLSSRSFLNSIVCESKLYSKSPWNWKQQFGALPCRWYFPNNNLSLNPVNCNPSVAM